MAPKPIIGLKREHFAHPLDLSGMKGLLDRIVKTSLIEKELAKLQADVEDEVYLYSLADNSKLSDKQGGSLYRMVKDVAGVFGTSTPNVFLDRTSEVRSSTLGGANPSMVFTSGLVDSLPEPATKAVIGHEFGHIVCGHTFYRLLAENYQVFSQLGGFIPVLGPVVSMGIVLQLFDWYKKSELSADRAGLLATQDLKAVQDYILRIAGGSSRLGPELSLAEFSRQADEFQDLVKQRRQQKIGRRVRFLLSSLMLQRSMSNNPWPAVRFKAITAWAESRQYACLLAGEYEEAAKLGQEDEASLMAFEIPTEDMKAYLDDLRQVAGDAVTGIYRQARQPFDWLLSEDDDSKPDKDGK